MGKSQLALYGVGRLTQLQGQALYATCQALAERQLKEPDKDLIATSQPEQHEHEIKLNVISAPSQINLTIEGLEGEGRGEKREKREKEAASESALVLFVSAFPE